MKFQGVRRETALNYLEFFFLPELTARAMAMEQRAKAGNIAPSPSGIMPQGDGVNFI
jgi:hypothetical protein